MNAISGANQTRSFLTILLFEFWERFGYYGTAVLMVLFMIQELGIRDADANLTWGTFSALVFAAPAVGGWIGDRVLGAKRSIILGACILTLGYLLLAVSGDKMDSVYIALGLIIVGSGLFKPNAANLVRCVYEGLNTKIDSVFTLYYMANNTAASLSVLLTPWIKDQWGWHTAFAVCCISLLIGLISYVYLVRALSGVGSAPDAQALHKSRFALVVAGCFAVVFTAAFIIQHKAVALACVYIGGIVVLGVFGHMIVNGSRAERAGLIAALVLVVEALLFFVFYEQVGTSLTLFAFHHVDWNQTLFGHHLFTWSPAQYAAVNALWVMALSLPLAWIYRQLGKHGHDLPVATKFVLGFIAVAVGFFIFGASGNTTVHGKVSSWFIIFGYGFYSLGELLIAALGLAMISRYVPARMSGFMMGAFFVAAGIAQYFGSVIANLASFSNGETDARTSLATYTRLFDHLGWLAVIGAAIAIALLPYMKRLSVAHDKVQHDLEKQEASSVATAR